MKAFDFEFDKRCLHEFDMIICRFGSGGLDTVSNGATVSFNTVPTLSGAKHELVSSVYEDCLETTIQICKSPCHGNDMEIDSTTFRELTKWLCKKRFLKFKLLSEEYIDLYYEVKIDVSRIELDGKLVGLELNIVANRPFALKEPRTLIVKLKEVYGWEEYEDGEYLGYITSTNEDEYPQDGLPIYDEENRVHQYLYLGEIYEGSVNDTSHEEGYIYPHTEITINESGDLKIYNAIEDRTTYIANCIAGEIITLDYPIIQSSVSSHNIQNDFNWNFFRIANTYENSRNDLIVTLPCSIKIKYSPIVKVGL